MTDEREEVPTPADGTNTRYYVSCESCGFGELVFPKTFSGAVECPKCGERTCDLVEKVVRRKDVEKLIQSYIQDVKSEIERIEEEDDIDGNSDVAKAHHELQIETLEGLLEEIEK